MAEPTPSRVVVGMTGTERLDQGMQLLESLRSLTVEAHLVLTPEAESALGDRLGGARALADQTHAHDNQAAPIASGSFRTLGMAVAPCDAHALVAIAMGLASNLLYRAADVTLKEGRPLVLLLSFAPASPGEIAALERASRVPGLDVMHAADPLGDVLDRLGLG